jgi:hypothetical protein
VTFGQGFEGIPRSAAVAAGSSTDVIGLTNNDSFRTNMVLIDASGAGATVNLSLRDPSNVELASGSYVLRAFEPVLDPVTDLGISTFEAGTLHAEVTSGSAIIFASKVDNDPSTGDPTTLEAWSAGGAASIDGTYQFATYDSVDYASGGNLVIANGEVTDINGTFTNWDKLDNGDPACTLLFLWGGGLVPAVAVEDFANGVVVENSYTDEQGAPSGDISYTLTFTVSDNMSITGTLDAAGSNFPAPDTGCNGDFPDLVFRGGKSN